MVRYPSHKKHFGIFFSSTLRKETSTSTLTNTIYLLAKHPEALQKAKKEVEEVLEGKEPDGDNLAQLPYCFAVVKESMRLMPAVTTAIPRVAKRDTVLLGYNVKEGTMISLDMAVAHFDEKHWPEPYEFRPERFLDGKPKMAYFPFGWGPQSCLGRKFALTQIQLVLAKLLQTFEGWQLPPAFQYNSKVFSISMRPRDGLPVNFVKKTK